MLKIKVISVVHSLVLYKLSIIILTVKCYKCCVDIICQMCGYAASALPVLGSYLD